MCVANHGMAKSGGCRKMVFGLPPIANVAPFKQFAQMFVISIILFTLGALNACFAMTATTCTQGDAGILGAGALTFILYIFGTVTLIASEPKRIFLLALSPAALIAIWHSTFAVRFFIGYWFQNTSACSAIDNFSLENAGENMDGSESYYTLLWLATSLVFWIGIYRGFRASRPDDQE